MGTAHSSKWNLRDFGCFGGYNHHVDFGVDLSGTAPDWFFSKRPRCRAWHHTAAGHPPWNCSWANHPPQSSGGRPLSEAQWGLLADTPQADQIKLRTETNMILDAFSDVICHMNKLTRVVKITQCPPFAAKTKNGGLVTQACGQVLLPVGYAEDLAKAAELSWLNSKGETGGMLYGSISWQFYASFIGFFCY